MRVREFMTFKPNEEDLSVLYEDETGKVWKFQRIAKPKFFIREDGLRISHTKLYDQYEYKGLYRNKNKGASYGSSKSVE
jgi:hypothetical protein